MTTGDCAVQGECVVVQCEIVDVIVLCKVSFVAWYVIQELARRGRKWGDVWSRIVDRNW